MSPAEERRGRVRVRGAGATRPRIPRKPRLIPKPTTGRGALVELVLIVALAIGLALGIQAFIVKPYQIPSPLDGADPRRRPAGAREPVLLPARRRSRDRRHRRLPSAGRRRARQRSAVSRSRNGATGQACPEPTPEMAETNFIKRVVAGPGDRLSIEDGIPIVNGEPPPRTTFARAADSAAATSRPRSRFPTTTTS